jgi:antitoxin component YwqK of YwqJK toxin-antitoxin module
MKRLIIIFHSVFILSINCISQKNIYFQNSENTSIIYLDCSGKITNKANAIIFRVAKFDNERFAFKDSVFDYFISNGKEALKMFNVNGLPEGQIKTYYENGSPKEIGIYKQGKRDSIWCFFYKNGNIEKKINYKNNISRLIEYYKKNGKPIFIDGNGEYKGECNTNANSCVLRTIKGKVKDGLMVDRWKIFIDNTISTEVFENGKFIRGKDDHNYTYENNGLISLTGFPYYENISLFDYSITCDKRGFFWPSYNKNVDLSKSFFYELRENILSNQEIDKNGFFYGLFEFRIEDGIIVELSFKQISNDNKISNVLKRLICSMNKWDKQEQKLSFTFFVPIIWENNRIYLEPKDYIIKN